MKKHLNDLILHEIELIERLKADKHARMWVEGGGFLTESERQAYLDGQLSAFLVVLDAVLAKRGGK